MERCHWPNVGRCIFNDGGEAWTIVDGGHFVTTLQLLSRCGFDARPAHSLRQLSFIGSARLPSWSPGQVLHTPAA